MWRCFRWGIFSMSCGMERSVRMSWYSERSRMMCGAKDCPVLVLAMATSCCLPRWWENIYFFGVFLNCFKFISGRNGVPIIMPHHVYFVFDRIFNVIGSCLIGNYAGSKSIRLISRRIAWYAYVRWYPHKFNIFLGWFWYISGVLDGIVRRRRILMVIILIRIIRVCG